MIPSLVFLSALTALTPMHPTFCNPLDLPYRFQLEAPSRREAADPTVVAYQGKWWLFASKSGGYWYTSDFCSWKFVEPTGLPLESYAPTVEIISGRLYFCAGGGGVYTTADPAEGKWEKVADIHGAADTDIFADDDGRVYLYYGCSDASPIQGEEVDPKNGFQTIGKPFDLISGRPTEHGWEAKREPNVLGNLEEDAKPSRAPWVEGSWMNKVDGRYLLQYAAPGTELDGYADGVYVSNHPLGPFTYQPSSPFSYRPSGFTRGAGHGSTFKDSKGNLWHIATVTIARRHMFERRLGMFPAKVFPDGQLACNTYLADYPQYVPGSVSDPFHANSPGWMLLSLDKAVEASSSLTDFPARFAVDESIKTWWCAATGNANEWLKLDLGTRARIEAVQINFADEGSATLNRLRNDGYRYTVEASDDGKTWRSFIDKSQNERDAPHDYIHLPHAIEARYLRLTNVHTPAGAKFSVSGFRVFGKAEGHAPLKVTKVEARRDATDSRRAHLSWLPAKGAEFYIVRYGIRPDRLFTNFEVYGSTELDLSILNTGVPYYFTVDAINASGTTPGPNPISLR